MTAMMIGFIALGYGLSRYFLSPWAGAFSVFSVMDSMAKNKKKVLKTVDTVPQNCII